MINSPREAIRDAFNPLPELQQNQATRPSNEIDDSLPVRTDEISLRELLVERNARLTDRAADEQAFAQQQSPRFCVRCKPSIRLSHNPVMRQHLKNEAVLSIFRHRALFGRFTFFNFDRFEMCHKRIKRR